MNSFGSVKVPNSNAFWAAPFVPQWFGALGTRRTRFVAFRDTNRDPAVGG